MASKWGLLTILTSWDDPPSTLPEKTIIAPQKLGRFTLSGNSSQQLPCIFRGELLLVSGESNPRKKPYITRYYSPVFTLNNNYRVFSLLVWVVPFLTTRRSVVSKNCSIFSVGIRNVAVTFFGDWNDWNPLAEKQIVPTSLELRKNLGRKKASQVGQ